jgi:hypothetical protein
VVSSFASYPWKDEGYSRIIRTPTFSQHRVQPGKNRHSVLSLFPIRVYAGSVEWLTGNRGVFDLILVGTTLETVRHAPLS